MQAADIVREVMHNECSLNQVEELEAPPVQSSWLIT